MAGSPTIGKNYLFSIVCLPKEFWFPPTAAPCFTSLVEIQYILSDNERTWTT